MESLSDIETELRTLSQSSKYCELQPTVSGKSISFYFAEIADRIKAAAPTTEKSSAVGNAATREALEAMNRINTGGLKRLLCELVELDVFDGGLINKTISAVEKARRALAEPPRNCDAGTLTEQQQRFHDFCEKMQHTDKACCGGCPIVYLRMKGVIDNSCELAWAQMPYEKEGGAV